MLMGRASAELNYIQVREIITGGLHEFLDSLQIRLNRIGDAVEQSFFALQPVPLAPPYAAGKDA
jgi:uncharacterized alpha-E superfamily protein